VGRYCGEDYGPPPATSNANDFVGSGQVQFDAAIARRDVLAASTGLDWRVIRVAFGFRVDRGSQEAVPAWLDPSQSGDLSAPEPHS
jgi:hypothetical protein